jgi:dolichyl-phosphate beta-glucosyltransferase
VSAAEKMPGNGLRLSLVVPAFNEAPRLSEKAVHLANAVTSGVIDPMTTELIVVDDGSTDGTGLVAQQLLSPVFPRMRILRLRENSGKGAAIRAGAAAAAAPIVAFMDADMSVDPAQIPLLVEAMEHADVVIGSRSLNDSVVQCDSLQRVVMGRTFNFLVNAVTRVGYKDTQCGFKAFRTPVARLLFHLMVVERFAFDVEVLCLAQRLGLRIAEVPVEWKDSQNSTVRPVSDAMAMTMDVFRLRFRKTMPHIPALVVEPDSNVRESHREGVLTQASSNFRRTDPVLPLPGGSALILLPLCKPTEVEGTASRLGTWSNELNVRKRTVSGAELMEMMTLTPNMGAHRWADIVRDVSSSFSERRGANQSTHGAGYVTQFNREPASSLEI